jgi:tetratricopeptide (TPR) repeat protein
MTMFNMFSGPSFQAIAALVLVAGFELVYPALVLGQASENPQVVAARKEAETAYQQGNFEKGIEQANTALGIDKADHPSLYLRASCRVELGQAKRDPKLIRQGIEDTREALKIGGPGNTNYYLPYLYGMTGLAYIENRKEHAETSAKIADSVLVRPNLKPEDKANILYQRAGAYMFLRSFDLASADYQAAIQQYQQHLGAHVGLAEAYVASGKPDLALQAFTAATTAFPTNPLVFNNRGIFLQQQNKPAEAIADFNQSLKLDANYFVGYTNRGFTYLSEGNPTAAEADFDKSLQVNPKQPLVHSLRGTARLAQGRVPDALQDYNQVLAFDPKNAVAMADLGFAKFFGKDYAGAIAAFDQAVASDPNLRYINPWRFWTMVMLGQKDAASSKFSDSFVKEADKRDWLDNLLCFLEGKISEQDVVNAVTQADPALRIAQTCEAYYFIAERRTLTGDPAGAKPFYQQALETKARHLSAFRGSQYALQQFTAPAK